MANLFPKYLYIHNHFGHIIFWIHYFWTIFFVVNFFLNPKCFAHKFLWQRIFWTLKTFWTQHFFWTKNSFLTRNFFDPQFFWSKIFHAILRCLFLCYSNMSICHRNYPFNWDLVDFLLRIQEARRARIIGSWWPYICLLLVNQCIARYHVSGQIRCSFIINY